MKGAQERSTHRSPHDAKHMPWEYGRGAAIWASGRPIMSNLLPLAGLMRDWLSGKNDGGWGPRPGFGESLAQQLNPYTENLNTLSACIAVTINDAKDFAESTNEIHPFEAEVRRIKLENELILYAARFCEAAIKQMLFCTDFDASLYKNATLGKLLEMDCRPCRDAGAPHAFSLIGSIAHQFFLCHVMEGCAFDHLVIANKRRKSEAAHSQTQAIQWRSVTDTRKAMEISLDDVVGAFSHLVGHISEIEEPMAREIDLRMRYYPSMPPIDSYNCFLTRSTRHYNSDGSVRYAMNSLPADTR